MAELKHLDGVRQHLQRPIIMVDARVHLQRMRPYVTTGSNVKATFPDAGDGRQLQTERGGILSLYTFSASVQTRFV